LELMENGLDGTLPPDIAILSNSLSVLDLSVNAGLSGTVPEEVGLLSKLTDLRLFGALPAGSIPVRVCALGVDVLVDCGRIECTCCGCPQTPASSFSAEPSTFPSETSHPTRDPTPHSKSPTISSAFPNVSLVRFAGPIHLLLKNF